MKRFGYRETGQMQVLGQMQRNSNKCEIAFRNRAILRLALAGLAGAMALGFQPLAAQGGGQTGSELRLGIAEIPTPLNKLPDANVQMALQAQKKAIRRFDAINALRQRQMEDESLRLLQLARDLQAKVQQVGDGPLPRRLVEEAEAIESLAHDVQVRMVLMVGGG